MPYFWERCTFYNLLYLLYNNDDFFLKKTKRLLSFQKIKTNDMKLWKPFPV